MTSCRLKGLSEINFNVSIISFARKGFLLLDSFEIREGRTTETTARRLKTFGSHQLSIKGGSPGQKPTFKTSKNANKTHVLTDVYFTTCNQTVV